MKQRLRRYLRELQEFDASMERLNELFIKAAEINSMPAGRIRDMQMLRLGIIAEFDAANLYELMADLASSEELRELFMDVANEEKVHIGEFEYALEILDPDHDKNVEEGEEEAEEVTGWEEPEEEEEKEEEVEEGLSESVASQKAKVKEIQKANQMRCKSILIQIQKRREDIKALLLQARQWDCGE